MNDLALVKIEAWGFRFTVMLTLSVIVAVMGLSANSAAVVIGAMLLAPLMTPVLGLAASLSMALVNKSAQSGWRVLLATAWCIGIAYVISLIIPDTVLSDEVIARTSPDVRDLVVALAAGLAGSYATVRTDASAALPGVAVAVALVPPLAAVGITLEAGRPELARGALLLYGTNLAAIILVGVVVFVLTGFVPPRRLTRSTPGIIAGTVIAAAVVVAMAIPLIRTSLDAAQSAQLQQEVDEAVSTWIEGYDLDIDDVDINTELNRVSVEISGLDRPPEQMLLEGLLVPTMGADVRANVQYTRTEQATTSTTIAPTTTVVSGEELRRKAVEGVVLEWLADGSEEDNSYELEAILLGDETLRVDVVGTGQAPSVDDLTERLTNELDEELSVTLTWIPRSIVAPSEEPTPFDLRRSTMAQTVDDFAAANDLVVNRFIYDGQAVVVEFTGISEPETTSLVLDLLDVAEDEIPVDIYFTERRRLETTTTTTTG